LAVVHTGAVHTGVVHTGVVHTGVVHTGVVHTGVVHTGAGIMLHRYDTHLYYQTIPTRLMGFPTAASHS
jgi:hypothetical protein